MRDDSSPMDFSSFDPGSGATRGFQFTVAGGQVTAVAEVIGARSFNLRIPSNASFTVAGSTITETLTRGDDTTIVVFTPEAADPALDRIASITRTETNPTTTDRHGDMEGFSFTIANGQVTAEQFVFDGRHSFTETLRPPPDAVFSVSGSTMSESFAVGDGFETRTFVQPAGSTLFAEASVSCTFVDRGSSTTRLDVEPFERAEFTLAGSAVTGVAAVDARGGVHSFTPNSHEAFTLLAPGFVEETVTFGSHVSYEVFYAGPNAGGVYTAVAHGHGSTVDLAGLQAQIAQLPTAVGWVI